MEDILISSPLFDPKKSKQYFLSIQLGLNGFSFCIIDAISNKLIYLNHLPRFKTEEIGKQTAAHDLLSLPFQKTNIMLCNGKVSSVPSALCLDQDNETLYQLTNLIGDDEMLLANKQEFSGMTHIYTIHKDLLQSLSKSFPEHKLIHYQQLLVWKSIRYSPSLSKEKVLLDIWDNEFHLLIARGEQILFLNHFVYHDVDEFLYFFLYAFKHLNLDPEETEVKVHGKIFKQSILIANLKKYIRKIEFETWPSDLNYSNAFMELPGHYFTNLCLLHQCE